MDKHKLVRSLGSFSIGPFIGALLGLITTPIFTYFLAPDEYGKANMFSVATTIVQLIIFLGMDQSYVKYYYDSNKRNKLLVNSLAPAVIIIAIIDLGIILLHNSISHLLFDNYAETSCIIALLAIIPALAVERFALLNIRMSQKGLLYSIMTIILKVLIIVVTVLSFCFFEKSFRSIVIGQTIAQVIFAITLILMQKEEFSVRFADLDKKEIAKLLKYGLPLVPTMVIGWALNGTDKIMMRAMCGYGEIGLYSVAARIAAALTIIQNSFSTFWVPLAHKWNSEKVDNKQFERIGKLLACAMSLVFLIVLLSKDVVFLLFKPEYQEATKIVPFLLFTPIMYTISEVTVMGIYFKEKTGWTVLVTVISSLINISLNALLIPKLGAVGASIATGLSYIVFFWARTLFSRRIWFPFKLYDYAFVTVILVIASAISTFTSGIISYAVCILSIVLLVIHFRSECKKLLEIAKEIANSILHKHRIRTDDGTCHGEK